MRSLLKSSKSCSNNKERAPAKMKCRYLAQQDWESVREVFSTEEGRVEVQEELVSLRVDSVIHFACRFVPPLDIIECIANYFPGSVSQVDDKGRSPLHVAVKWGSHPRVIQFLIKQQPKAAELQDAMGMTPLHLFCESYAQNYSSSKGGRPLKDAMFDVVRLLCRAAPNSVNIEDNDDMTALEYAIDADLDLKVVRIIQKSCEKDWKNRRAPGTRHETRQQSLLVQSQQQSQRLRIDLMEMSQSAMNRSMSSLQNGETKIAGMERIPVPVRPRKQTSTRALTA